MRKDGLYQIGEVAERTQLPLLRLELVKRLKLLDLPLEDTKEMLAHRRAGLEVRS